jgi:hypothetical protein
MDALPALPAGSKTVGAYVSLRAENTFPALPVRDDVVAIVRVVAHRTRADADTHVSSMGTDVATHRISPTPRSRSRE